MKLCLFDASGEAATQWGDYCRSHSLTFSSFSRWNPASIAECGQIVVFDESAFAAPFLPSIRQIAADYRQCVIVVTREKWTVPQVVELMSNGIQHVFEKPYAMDAISVHMPKWISVARAMEEHRTEFEELKELFHALTPREIEVLESVLAGISNRDTAKELSVSVRTVESRRAKVYRKLQAVHLADLVRKSDRLQQLQEIFDSKAEPNASIARQNHDGHLVPAFFLLRKAALMVPRQASKCDSI